MRQKLSFKFGLVILFALLMLVACGGDGGNGGTEEQSSSGEDAQNTEDEDQESLTLTVGGMSAVDNPITISLNEYTERIEEETDGRLQFDVFPANQLGDYTLMYEELIKGTLDMALISIPSQFDERTEMLMMPYLIENYDQAEETFGIDSFIYNKTQEIIGEQGVHLLGFRPIGFGGVSSTKPINDPTGLGTDKDVLVRIPQMNVYKTYAEEMGYRTVSIPWADIYSGLQTGTAEGVIGAQPAANYLDFGDVIKHYYQYNYSFESLALMISDEAWNKLSEEDQEIMKNAGAEFTTNSFKEAQEIDEHYREEMRNEGIEVVEFSDEELKEMADYTREKAWPLMRESLGDEILDELLKMV